MKRGQIIPYSRFLLFAPLVATATVAFAADLDGDGCEDTQYALNGACIHDTASLDATVTTTSQTYVAEGVSIGPFVALGDVFIGKNAIIEGWDAHSTQPLTVGDGTVIGRNANIGADSILGTDTSIARGVTVGARATTGEGVSIGYAAELGTDVLLDSGAVIGSRVGLGNFTHMGPLSVIGRNSTVASAGSPAERSDILGIVGPNVTIEEEVLVSNSARVRKGATIEFGAQIMDEATVGRDAVVETMATVHANVRAYGRVCAGDTAVTGQVVPRNMTNQGTSTCSAPAALIQRARPLAVGGTHACAVLPDETAVCWGNNTDGQLGNGTRNNQSLPVAVIGLNDVAGFALNSVNSCALKTDGTVWCWGELIESGIFTTPQDVPGLTDIISIASGGAAYCAVKSDETVMCWGFTPFGQHGNPAAGVITNTPVPVIAADGNPLSGIIDIAVGSEGVCGLTTSGDVFCWGGGAQQGDAVSGLYPEYGGWPESITPLRVVGLANVVEISMGRFDVLALQDGGTVMAWRYTPAWTNRHEILPIRAYTDLLDVDSDKIAAIGVYGGRSCLIVSEFHWILPDGADDWTQGMGYVYCADGESGGDVEGSAWGERPDGMLDNLDPVVELAHGSAANLVCARRSSGDVWCLGSGSYTPVPVSGLNMGPL